MRRCRCSPILPLVLIFVLYRFWLLILVLFDYYKTLQFRNYPRPHKTEQRPWLYRILLCLRSRVTSSVNILKFKPDQYMVRLKCKYCTWSHKQGVMFSNIKMSYIILLKVILSIYNQEIIVLWSILNSWSNTNDITWYYTLQSKKSAVIIYWLYNY